MNTLQYIIKRNGQRVAFDRTLIFVAIEKAFLSDNLIDTSAVAALTDEVVSRAEQRLGASDTTQVEDIQDIVEDVLMKNGYHRIAKNYILYRERRTQVRQQQILDQIKKKKLEVQLEDGSTATFDAKAIIDKIHRLSAGLRHIDVSDVIDSVVKLVYDRITKKELDLLVLGAARERIERHYDYSYLASRIALSDLYRDVLKVNNPQPELEKAYKAQFKAYIQHGTEMEMLNAELSTFNLDTLAAALEPQRDDQFMYLGIQILMDRYLLRDRSTQKQIYELPQWFWMRVAMGLALKEKDREKWAIAFYQILSKMDLVSSTPTLFNSGTNHSQMSSCYINIADDSLTSIFKLYGDNANLSKWAGGIGTSWTRIRATGSKIKGTNGESQGVIPFIKIYNDVALAVNQGGKRKGAMCAYMEVWHLDFEQFLELKKNTGDERRRAHDINTAAWIPDLFIKRVKENGNWTLFCPSQVPDLHDLYGQAFEDRYVQYEQQNMPRAKTVKATDLWRKMLTMLYETGHPWHTYKDVINLRNPQDHVGVVHSSNLCTEITLNTSNEETAVCNLASLNLANMITDGDLDEDKIRTTVEIGIRMLDNVIDNNFYPIPEAETANLRHRAIGLGVMGYQDALYQLNIKFRSNENMEFADRSMEIVSYYAILASAKLARERGAYSTFKGSKWDRGIFPYDTLKLVDDYRGEPIKVDRSIRMNWDSLKAQVQQWGMRNSNTMAIAPTATISNITGVYPCTEPAYKNIYMKENLSGNFVVVNRYLVDDLERLGLWNTDMLNQIKLNDGSIQNITEIPEFIREKYREIFEIEPQWILQSAARRAKWIDQSASTNIFLTTTSGKMISDTYMTAWEYGLKTTYYLRTLGASQVTKATTSTPAYDVLPQPTETIPEVKVCALNDPTCEVCQ